MSRVALAIIRRLQPEFGWVLFVLAFVAGLCPAIAGSESDLNLPVWWIGLAGTLGLLLGIFMARERLRRRIVVWLCCAALLIVAAVCMLLAIGEALPPQALVLRDGETYAFWVRASLQTKHLAVLPKSLTADFLLAAVPRFWRTLLAAPANGETGARLLLSVYGMLATCVTTTILGWALQAQRILLGWSLPLAGVVVAITVLGGGSGSALAVQICLLLTLAVVTNFRRAEARWRDASIDYSDQIQYDLFGWSIGVVVALVVIGVALPTATSTPLAELLWGKVDLPSGIAVLDRNGGPPPAPVVRIALSTLPTVPLGVSLEQGAPETIALRIQVDQPLPESATPHYWRARLLNLFDGRQWWSNARVEPNAPGDNSNLQLPGYIRQEIEDLRPDRDVLVGLPNLVGVSVPAQAERLADGTLAALTSEDVPQRYRALSAPQERVAMPPLDGPQPDLGDSLAVPRATPPRVKELAETVAGTGTPAERALAIESYLRALPYAYQVQQLPNNGDAVDQFLFEMRQGYCTYYASAMTIMARSLGIPARVAIGYASGSYDEATKTYTVREADAHAWPELYVDGRWTAYEPTPIRSLPARGTAPSAPAIEPLPAPQETPAQPQIAWTAFGVVLAAFVLLAIALAVRMWLRRAAPIPLALAQLERAGTRAGVPWPAGATLREYASALESRLGRETQSLHTLIELVERARYHGETLNAGESEQMQASSRRVIAQLAASTEKRRLAL